MMMGVRAIGKASVLAVALSAGVATAELEQVEVETVAVSFAELDLSKPAGVEALYERLHRAAERVCGFDEPTSSLVYASRAAEKRSCYEEALDRAVTQIDSPLLNEQHSG